MANDFYERASALRDKYQSELDNYGNVSCNAKIEILTQIVANVFANGDKIPDTIAISFNHSTRDKLSRAGFSNDSKSTLLELKNVLKDLSINFSKVYFDYSLEDDLTFIFMAI